MSYFYELTNKQLMYIENSTTKIQIFLIKSISSERKLSFVNFNKMKTRMFFSGYTRNNFKPV